MLKRMGLLLMMLFIASSVMAWDEGCAPEYTQEQCAQMGQDGPPGTTTGGTCPYYMCGNATGAVQNAWGWCSASDPPQWTNCPIEYCEYRACVGLNCYPTWNVCESCASRDGNHVHLSECPRK